MKLKLLPFSGDSLKIRNAVKALFLAALTMFLFTGAQVFAQNGWVRVGNGGQVPGQDLKESPSSAHLSGWYSCSEGYSVYVNYVADWNSEMCDDNWEPTMQKLEYALGGNNHVEVWWHTYTKYTFNDYLRTVNPVRAWCQGPTITPGDFIYDESACYRDSGGGGGECPCGDCTYGCNGGGGDDCTMQYIPGQCYETCVTIGDEEDPYTGECIGCQEECSTECDPGTWVCM
jgi:hypothetical protein